MSVKTKNAEPPHYGNVTIARSGSTIVVTYQFDDEYAAIRCFDGIERRPDGTLRMTVSQREGAVTLIDDNEVVSVQPPKPKVRRTIWSSPVWWAWLAGLFVGYWTGGMR